MLHKILILAALFVITACNPINDAELFDQDNIDQDNCKAGTNCKPEQGGGTPPTNISNYEKCVGAAPPAYSVYRNWTRTVRQSSGMNIETRLQILGDKVVVSSICSLDSDIVQVAVQSESLVQSQTLRILDNQQTEVSTPRRRGGSLFCQVKTQPMDYTFAFNGHCLVLVGWETYEVASQFAPLL